MKHIHLPTNSVGKDYIVGDIHGCCNELLATLKKIHFNFANDRLFSVGDLIDRGPQSYECANLIYQPWFFAVRGNHEQLMIDSIIKGSPAHVACWMQNGGLWSTSEAVWELTDLSNSFDNLPLVISVGDGADRFNIVHAEFFAAGRLFTDQMIDEWDIDADIEHNMLWGRNIIDAHYMKSTHQYHSNELSTTYVGHSIIPYCPIQIQKQVYIDTGCVNSIIRSQLQPERYTLTIVCPTDQVYYTFTLPFRTVAKNKYARVLKHNPVAIN
jgi:serine/threonine protein phosphatase 1